ncbi:hypothetical protein ACKS0A_05821 [Histoplasma ohiense]
MICDQNILWFKVPVVDSNGVTVLHSIQNLEKSTFGKEIVSNKLAFVSNVGEKIALRAKLNNNKSTIKRIHYADQRNHIGMLTGQMMELDFPLLKFPLSRVQTCFVEGFNGVRHMGMDVDSGIHNTIRTYPKNACKF